MWLRQQPYSRSSPARTAPRRVSLRMSRRLVCLPCCLRGVETPLSVVSASEELKPLTHLHVLTVQRTAPPRAPSKASSCACSGCRRLARALPTLRLALAAAATLVGPALRPAPASPAATCQCRPARRGWPHSRRSCSSRGSMKRQLALAEQWTATVPPHCWEATPPLQTAMAAQAMRRRGKQEKRLRWRMHWPAPALRPCRQPGWPRQGGRQHSRQPRQRRQA